MRGSAVRTSLSSKSDLEITPLMWAVANLPCRGYPRNRLFQKEGSCHHSSVTAC